MAFRVRFRDAPPQVVNAHTVRWPSTPSSGLNNVASVGSTQRWTGTSCIHDFSDRRRVKPVVHVKATWVGQPAPSVVYDPSATWYQEHYAYQGDGTVLTSSPWGFPGAGAVYSVLPWIPDPSPSLKGTLADEAFDAFYNQVPQEVDISNFLLDLRQLGDLIPKLEETMLKSVSGGFLNYSFGWKPLLGDLEKLGRLSATVQKRIKYLLFTRGRTTRLGFSTNFSFEGSTATKSTGQFDASFVSAECRFVAGGYLFHQLRLLEGLEGQLRGFSAALGLNSPSRVVWERIPFSFVVDWFSRTKHITESLTTQPYPGEWLVRDLSHSFRQKVVWKVTRPRSSLMPWKTMTWGHLTIEKYIRDVNLPVSSSLMTGDITTGQLALAAALVGAASR